MDDYGDALEPLQQLIKELTPDGAWLFGPEGKALAKLPSPGFAWQGGEPVAISTARVGPLRELCAAIGAKHTGNGGELRARLKRLTEGDLSSLTDDLASWTGGIGADMATPPYADGVTISIYSAIATDSSGMRFGDCRNFLSDAYDTDITLTAEGLAALTGPAQAVALRLARMVVVQQQADSLRDKSEAAPPPPTKDPEPDAAGAEGIVDAAATAKAAEEKAARDRLASGESVRLKVERADDREQLVLAALLDMPAEEAALTVPTGAGNIVGLAPLAKQHLLRDSLADGAFDAAAWAKKTAARLQPAAPSTAAGSALPAEEIGKMVVAGPTRRWTPATW
jgi:hypothetical protein